jgi:hypothetical protein
MEKILSSIGKRSLLTFCRINITTLSYNDTVQFIMDINEQQEILYQKHRLGFFGINVLKIFKDEMNGKFYHMDEQLLAKRNKPNILKILYFPQPPSKTLMIPFTCCKEFPIEIPCYEFWFQIQKALKQNHFPQSKLSQFLSRLEYLANEKKNNNKNIIISKSIFFV